MKPPPRIPDIDRSVAPLGGLSGLSGRKHVAIGLLDREGRRIGDYRVELHRPALPTPLTGLPGESQLAMGREDARPARAAGVAAQPQGAFSLKRVCAALARAMPNAGSVLGGSAHGCQQEARDQ